MAVTLPRSTLACQSLARSGTLVTLLCLMCYAAASPLKKETQHETSHHQGSAGPVQRVTERPAVHFQADPVSPSLTWTANIDNAFTQGSLTLENNKLHVHQDGLYFIYTQATFGDLKCPKENINLVSLTVILESILHGEEMQLLRADKTPCEQPRAASANNMRQVGWYKPIFLAGAFRLVKGDKLYVYPSGEKYIQKSNGATYFGAYAL